MRVLVADRDAAYVKSLKDFLTPLGYQVIADTDDGITALRMVHSIQPDLLIVDAFLPGVDGIELGKIVEEGKLAPVIVVASYNELEMVNQKGEMPFPVLPKPTDFAALKSVIDYVLNTFRKVNSLEQEVLKLQSNLAARKVVEKAKGILMKTQNLSEDDAFKRMQQMSMKKRLSMRKVAEAIIVAYE